MFIYSLKSLVITLKRLLAILNSPSITLKYSLTFKSDHLSFHTQVYKRITKKYT